MWFICDFIIVVLSVCGYIQDSSEVPQLSLPSDEVAEADSSLNAESTTQYVWVSRTVVCRCVSVVFAVVILYLFFFPPHVKTIHQSSVLNTGEVWVGLE